MNMNLDKMNRKELETFVDRAENDTRVFAREVFGNKQAGRVAAMQPLRWYAFNKLQVMDCKTEQDAVPFVSICEGLYRNIIREYPFAAFRGSVGEPTDEFEKLWASVGEQFKTKEARYALKVGFEYGKSKAVAKEG